jgi:hypothetical protein
MKVFTKLTVYTWHMCVCSSAFLELKAESIEKLNFIRFHLIAQESVKWMMMESMRITSAVQYEVLMVNSL